MMIRVACKGLRQTQSNLRFFLYVFIFFKDKRILSFSRFIFAKFRFHFLPELGGTFLCIFEDHKKNEEHIKLPLWTRKKIE